MGIETGEREAPVVVERQEQKCADSENPTSEPSRDEENNGPLESGNGAEHNADEEEDMSIYSEKQPRNIVHLETVYDSDDEFLLFDGIALHHEQLFLDVDSCKAIKRQIEGIPTEDGLRHLSSLHQNWTISSNDKDTFYKVSEYTENGNVESIIDSNGNITQVNDATGSKTTEASGRRGKKNVFVRRGDSSAWRVWQEILGQGEHQSKLHARYETQEPIVMCFPCSLAIFLSIEGKPLSNRTKIFLEARDSAGDLLLSGPFTTKKNRIDIEFVANVRGRATVSLRCMGPKSSEVIPYEMKVDISGNNPLMSFHDDCSWPVAVAYDEKHRLLYVAFDNYITQYIENGELVEYSKQLAQLEDCHYNDLTLSLDGSILVASYSGWKTLTLKFRCQAIHMYDTNTGDLVQTIDNEFPVFIFDSPILHIATKDEETMLVADRASICECSLSTGQITARLSTEGMGSVSRIAYSRNRYFIADAKSGSVKIYDELGILERSFQVTTSSGEQVVGMTGLAVDGHNNIIVSDCLSGTIKAYREDGTLFCSIESDWDFVQWPLHLTPTPDGHIYVVDHRHGCVKKFRYL